MKVVGKEEFNLFINSRELEESVCEQCPVSCRLFKRKGKIVASVVLYEELTDEHKFFKDNIYKIKEYE